MVEDSPLPIDDDRICVGIVTGVHGLKGLVRVKPFTETPEAGAACSLREPPLTTNALPPASARR